MADALGSGGAPAPPPGSPISVRWYSSDDPTADPTARPVSSPVFSGIMPLGPSPTLAPPTLPSVSTPASSTPSPFGLTTAFAPTARFVDYATLTATGKEGVDLDSLRRLRTADVEPAVEDAYFEDDIGEDSHVRSKRKAKRHRCCCCRCNCCCTRTRRHKRGGSGSSATRTSADMIDGISDPIDSDPVMLAPGATPPLPISTPPLSTLLGEFEALEESESSAAPIRKSVTVMTSTGPVVQTTWVAPPATLRIPNATVFMAGYEWAGMVPLKDQVLNTQTRRLLLADPAIRKLLAPFTPGTYLPKIFSWTGKKEAVRYILRQFESNPQTPVVLIGHSYGADSLVWVAEELGRKRILVDLMIMIDSVGYDDDELPRSVIRGVNISQGEDHPFLITGARNVTGALKGVENEELKPPVHYAFSRNPGKVEKLTHVSATYVDESIDIMKRAIRAWVRVPGANWRVRQVLRTATPSLDSMLRVAKSFS